MSSSIAYLPAKNNPRSMSVPTIQTVKERVVFFCKGREKISTLKNNEKLVEEKENLRAENKDYKMLQKTLRSRQMGQSFGAGKSNKAV